MGGRNGGYTPPCETARGAGVVERNVECGNASCRSPHYVLYVSSAEPRSNVSVFASFRSSVRSPNSVLPPPRASGQMTSLLQPRELLGGARLHDPRGLEAAPRRALERARKHDLRRCVDLVREDLVLRPHGDVRPVAGEHLVRHAAEEDRVDRVHEIDLPLPEALVAGVRRGNEVDGAVRARGHAIDGDEFLEDDFSHRGTIPRERRPRRACLPEHATRPRLRPRHPRR